VQSIAGVTPSSSYIVPPHVFAATPLMQPGWRVDTGMPGNLTDATFTTIGIFPSFALPIVRVSCAWKHVPPGQSKSWAQDQFAFAPPLQEPANGNGIDRKSLAIATPLVLGLMVSPYSHVLPGQSLLVEQACPSHAPN